MIMTNASEILNQDRITKAILYVQFSLKELETHGYVKNVPNEITDKGKEGFRLLKESGFVPTDEEIQLAIYIIINHGVEDDPK
jgi:hypothetical protein